MKLYLDNVGKISDSEILIEGLTVITGENNSGKTTIGKTMYSIVSAVEDLQKNAFTDKRNFAAKATYKALSRFSRYHYINIDINATDASSIFDINFKQLDRIEDIIFFIEDKINKINNSKEADLYEFLKELPDEVKETVKSKVAQKRFVDNFMKVRTEVVKSLNEIKKNLKADPKSVEYANAKIIKTLNNEFYNQIKGINNESKESKIRLSNGKEYYYDIKLFDNELTNKDEIFFSQAFDYSLFIDDVFVVDDMMYRGNRQLIRLERSLYPNEEDVNFESFFKKLPRRLHREKLLDTLLKNNNVFEENLYKAKTENIIKCMKNANPGQIAFVKDKYVIDGLDIRNLAMGSKMFLIIKTLIENGHCGQNTLLILDEPETHLHPEWQNILAETIVLLVKMLETKVILTTHSPNFLLAIDVFTKKHEMRKITHFYKSISLKEKKKVKLQNFDKNINEIYSEMTKPFVELESKVDYL